MYDEPNISAPNTSATSAGEPVPPSGEAERPFGSTAGEAGTARDSFPPGSGFPTGAVPPQGYPAGWPQNLPPAPDAPVPWLAALLGLIPGVGAMYNGQFAKGLAHLAIFAVLASLADHVNGIFGLFVAGWVFYQVFEAFHTARARRYGQPLPNAFGLNDIGERLGFPKNWPAGSVRPAGPPPDSANWQAQSYATPPSSSSNSAGSYPPPPDPGTSPFPPVGANWAGYVPPSAFANASQPFARPPAEATRPQQGPAATNPVGWNSVPYPAAYTEVSSYPSYASAPLPTTTLTDASARRFPIGAVLLIVLGGIFLLSNIAPAWRLGEKWLVPVVLAATSVWTLFRRIRVPSGAGSNLSARSLVCALRLPAVLMVLAGMFTLQALGLLTIGQSWPLLLIVLGLLVLLERTVGRPAQLAPDASGPTAPVTAAPASDVAGRGNV